jgi:hypothetical protein
VFIIYKTVQYMLKIILFYRNVFMLVSIEALLFVTIDYNYSRVKLLVIQRIIQSNHSIDYQDEL